MTGALNLNSRVDRLILDALEEDVPTEDMSTCAVIKEGTPGVVDLVSKDDGVICGLGVFGRVFTLLDERTKAEFSVEDGDRVTKGQKIGEISGDMKVLLMGERTALNFLQRMSGIATMTFEMASLLEGTGVKLLDTRKTTPNMRLFEKYAVKVGGGRNHRFSLSDGILLKDNHIAAAGGVRKAVEAAKAYAPHVLKVEVEVENLDMCREALDAGADIIMLDNMSAGDMKKAVEMIGGRALTEVSGNVTKETIGEISSLGVDFVSVGALTHSAPAFDLSMKNMRRAGEKA
ncbi:MAG: carboxylating nicotinate-nucleotide diphosphorylase [Clostridia bacterium]|nr:carboxylating nicotinate-nucleotide diphosphorylase [Clostridia bacterium]